MALTQTQLCNAVADRAALSKADAKRALVALDEIVLEQLGNAEKVRIGGLVQLTVRVKPAQKKRQGRNPATGEEITIAVGPAPRRYSGASPFRTANLACEALVRHASARCRAGHVLSASLAPAGFY